MIDRAFRAGYRRLGRRYPRFAAVLAHQLAFFVAAAGIGLLTVYRPLGDDFWRLLLVSEGLVFVENVFALRVFSRLLRPVDAWLGGDRSTEATTRAWRVLAELPSSYTRALKLYPVAVSVVPFCVYATIELGLPWYSFWFLLAGALVCLGWGVFLRFFVLEMALRPVIEDVSCGLPADFDIGRRGISLRARLLFALPLLNVITGVAVAGLSAEGSADLTDLGLDVAIAVAVAGTLALELTLLLSASIVGPIHALRRATQAVGRGDLDVHVPVTSTDETGELAQSFNAALAGLRERERLREAFGAYVDPELAERVVAEGPSLEGEDVEVTVLFVDIRDFTAMAEESSAREVVALLNDYFACIVPIVQEHGGHANKFVGDGLLAVFGAPERRPDHADRAVAAALDIARRVRESFGDRLRIGVGVNSGPVVVGTVGGGGRVDYTVIGDPVNTAARVEAATRRSGDDVLITEATRCLLERDFGQIEPRPDIPLKGKTEPVVLYAVTGPAARPPSDGVTEAVA